jgi:hypothetical protein
VSRAPLARGLACALALCAACGGDENTLEGSLGTEVPLDFSAVAVENSGAAVAIVYTKDLPGGSSPDLVLKVTANTSGLDLTHPLTIDLTEKVANQPRGAVSRAVSGDARRDFPPMLRGSITFAQAPAVGSKVTGSFTVTFSNATTGSLGQGKTAFGNFSAVIKAPGT